MTSFDGWKCVEQPSIRSYNMNQFEAVDLDQIVVDVFGTMLSDQVMAVDEPWHSDVNRLTASVHFAGPAPGALLVECSKQDACCVAELLTGIRHDEVSEDVLDSLAEMANMVGGNLKSLLHAGAGLSIPIVVEGSAWASNLPASEPHRRRAFACGTAVFWVTYVAEQAGGLRA